MKKEKSLFTIESLLFSIHGHIGALMHNGVSARLLQYTKRLQSFSQKNLQVNKKLASDVVLCISKFENIMQDFSRVLEGRVFTLANLAHLSLSH